MQVSSESDDSRTEDEFEERSRRSLRSEMRIPRRDSISLVLQEQEKGGRKGHNRAMHGAIIIALESSAHRSFFPKIWYPPVRPSFRNYEELHRPEPMMIADDAALLGASFPTRAPQNRGAFSCVYDPRPEPRRPFLACT